MVSTSRMIVFIVLLALVATTCMARSLKETEDDDSLETEAQYHLRKMLNEAMTIRDVDEDSDLGRLAKVKGENKGRIKKRVGDGSLRHLSPFTGG
jgi:hypothetical protein